MRNKFQEKWKQRLVTRAVAAADMDTDASGDVTFVIAGLRNVEMARLDIGGGYRADLQSISLNSVTFRVYTCDYDAVADGPLIAHTSATDIAAGNIIAEGY